MISHKALRRFYWLVCALAVVGCFHLETKMVRAANTIETTVQPVKTKEAAAPATTTKSRHMRTPINWRKSSETVAYPNLATAKHFWIKVRLKQNRVYLLNGRKLLYTMYCTGGTYSRDKQTGKMKSATPTGTFYAQAERGDSFFNQSLNEGANYWVSWLNHGEYLFHSVPTVAGGAYNKKEAAKLGKAQGSHGCIRLSVPDAKWMAANLPVGTKIVIEN